MTCSFLLLSYPGPLVRKRQRVYRIEWYLSSLLVQINLVCLLVDSFRLLSSVSSSASAFFLHHHHYNRVHHDQHCRCRFGNGVCVCLKWVLFVHCRVCIGVCVCVMISSAFSAILKTKRKVELFGVKMELELADFKRHTFMISHHKYIPWNGE